MTKKEFAEQIGISRSKSLHDYENSWYVKIELKDGRSIVGMIRSYELGPSTSNITIEINNKLIKFNNNEIKYIS